MAVIRDPKIKNASNTKTLPPPAAIKTSKKPVVKNNDMVAKIEAKIAELQSALEVIKNL